MSKLPENPPYLRSYDYWIAGRGKNPTTVAYYDVEGRSPKLQNYLSSVTFKILSGQGSIQTEQSVMQFDHTQAEASRTTVIIPRKQQYQYEGSFTTFVEWPGVPQERFISIDNEPLEREDMRSIRKAERQVAREAFMADLVETALVHMDMNMRDIENYVTFTSRQLEIDRL